MLAHKVNTCNPRSCRPSPDHKLVLEGTGKHVVEQGSQTERPDGPWNLPWGFVFSILSTSNKGLPPSNSTPCKSSTGRQNIKHKNIQHPNCNTLSLGSKASSWVGREIHWFCGWEVAPGTHNHHMWPMRTHPGACAANLQSISWSDEIYAPRLKVKRPCLPKAMSSKSLTASW